MEAALKEGGSGPRTVKVRGSEFVLPDEQPGDVILAIRAFNRAQREGDDQQFLDAMLDMAEIYVGGGPLRRFLRSVSASEVGEALNELLEAIHNEYGTDTGESSASQSS